MYNFEKFKAMSSEWSHLSSQKQLHGNPSRELEEFCGMSKPVFQA